MTKGDLQRRARLMSGVATGVALLFMSAGPVFAQDTAQAEEGDEIVVTGIRRAIEDSIEVKREETSIVEVVSAEEIGKLPDVSIAESIARLPGLTAQRLNGRGQVISVRGLSPDFTTALLNGREQVSVGDNRGVEFDQYPSELLSSVVVYKTPDASLIGQGLAGTIDLRTVRPLSQSERTFAVGARYEWNDNGALNAGTEDTGYRFNLAYADQFMDGRLGVALGVATMLSPSQAERWNAWGFPDLNATTRVLGGAKPYVQSNELERTGVIGVLEFEPTETFSTSLDIYYSTFEDTQTLRGIELPLQWSSASLQPGFQTAGGYVSQGQFNGVKGVVRNDVNYRDAETRSIGWNSQWEASDRWTIESDLAFSGVERTDQILETYAGTGPSGSGPFDNLGFRVTGDGTYTFTPSINYASYDVIRLTSPQGWGGDVIPGGQVGYLNQPTIVDELTSLRLSAERVFDQGVVSSLEFGINRSRRFKSFDSNEWFLGLAGGALSAVVPTSARLGTTSLDFLGIPGMISYDPQALLGSGVYQRVRNPNGDVAVKDWKVEEMVTLAYVQANIDSMMWGVPVRGNVGLQVVTTDQESTATAVSSNGSTFQAAGVRQGDSYTEMLPSVNMTWELTDNSFFRLAAARTLARPRMDQMRAGRTFSFSTDPARLISTDINFSPWSGGGGNPYLRPWIANAFDVSYERYFADRSGYFALAGFYKDLESYVFDSTSVQDFTGFPTGGLTPRLFQGLINTPVNGQGGWIRGLELTVSVPFEVLTPSLEGFGVIFSASKTASEVTPDPARDPITLPGLSEDIVSTTVYFERHGFQARVSHRYRSEFLGEVSGFANGRNLRMVDSEQVVDGQIGYRFDQGPLSGLSLVLQGNNLTDEEFSTFNDGRPAEVIDFQQYGRTFMFGVSYRH